MTDISSLNGEPGDNFTVSSGVSSENNTALPPPPTSNPSVPSSDQQPEHPTSAPQVSPPSPRAGQQAAPAQVSAVISGFRRNGLTAGQHSSLTRCGFVGGMILFLLIPLWLVRGVVYERMALYEEATNNITASWGNSQTVSGPALIIPFETWQDKKEKVTVMTSGYNETKEVITRQPCVDYKVVLPAEVNFAAEMNPEIRYRGIYRQALYNAPVDVSGEFNLPTTDDFGPDVRAIHWDKAYLSVGVTDLKAIAEAPPAIWAGKPLAAYKPGTDADVLLGAGFHTPVPLTRADAGSRQAFAFKLRIRGSGGMYFTPTGENTTITMNGTWPSPSFKGNLLPVERAVSDQGFSAKWAISSLTRTYPQMANLSSDEYIEQGIMRSRITRFTAGVDLHEPVTLYRMVGRSVDYGILFIAVTFVALLAFEMVSRQRMHMVQYAMVGVSMCVFYLVLLSLAEHVSFGLAFVTAGAVTIAMNSLYIASVLQSRKKGMVLAGLLTGLYAVLFSLLRMEDFSLLLGTGLVLVMMGALMFVTRKLPQAGEKEAIAA